MRKKKMERSCLEITWKGEMSCIHVCRLLVTHGKSRDCSYGMVGESYFCDHRIVIMISGHKRSS